MAPRPSIAILTDFGAGDAYAGTMEGVIAGICPDARVIHLCHEVPPQDIIGGSLLLRGAYAFFPKETIFLCVVDPGVGTKRRAIAMRAGAHTFVGPDNGLLAWAAEEAAGDGLIAAHELTAHEYQLATVSATFHGRDIFAPAAAYLANGITIDRFGPPVEEWQRISVPATEISDHGMVRGEVLHIDGFGNLITNISRADLERSHAISPESKLGVHFRGARVAHLSMTYGDATAKSVIALFGSSGLLEIAVSGGSAKDRFGARRGEHVTVVPAEAQR